MELWTEKTLFTRAGRIGRSAAGGSKRGASIIMHGYTHQNEFSPTTGEGYEFWNAKDDRPMEDEESFTVPRIEAGISELLRCGLIPLAFEAPHYAASQKHMRF